MTRPGKVKVRKGEGDSHQIWRIQEKEKETAASNRSQPTIARDGVRLRAVFETKNKV
jgi:hypothetical protein